MNFVRAVVSKSELYGHAFNYLVVIVCIVAFSALDLAGPHQQQFALDNPSLAYPYATHESVTTVQAGILAGLVPAIIMLFWCLTLEGRVLTIRKLKFPARLQELNVSILGLLLSIGFALVVTSIIKNTVGRPRPDLIDRCQPIANAITKLMPYQLSNISVCTQMDHNILEDGYRSFPSGHSSSAFAGLGYLAFWLAAKLRILDGTGQVWKVAVVTTPIMGATLIAASRVMDARHHAFDVLFGSALGIATAWLSYRQYFPAIRESGVSHGPKNVNLESRTVSQGERRREQQYTGSDHEDTLSIEMDNLLESHRTRGAASTKKAGLVPPDIV